MLVYVLLCSSCGKCYADSWAVSFSKRMFKVSHRYIVLSIASELWPYLKDNWLLLKVYQYSVIDVLNDYLPKGFKERYRMWRDCYTAYFWEGYAI
jgi:hypothetical protein